MLSLVGFLLRGFALPHWKVSGVTLLLVSSTPTTRSLLVSAVAATLAAKLELIFSFVFVGDFFQHSMEKAAKDFEKSEEGSEQMPKHDQKVAFMGIRVYSYALATLLFCFSVKKTSWYGAVSWMVDAVGHELPSLYLEPRRGVAPCAEEYLSAVLLPLYIVVPFSVLTVAWKQDLHGNGQFLGAIPFMIFASVVTFFLWWPIFEILAAMHSQEL